MQRFGARLKALRKESGLTQIELANKLSVHISYIGLLERGERIPSLPTLTRIAKFFGIKPSDFIIEEDKSTKLTMKQKALLYIINEGDKEQIEKIHKIAKIVIDK